MTVCSGRLTAARGSKVSHLQYGNALITEWRLTLRVGYVVSSGHPPPVAAISTWPSDGSKLINCCHYYGIAHLTIAVTRYGRVHTSQFGHKGQFIMHMHNITRTGL